MVVPRGLLLLLALFAGAVPAAEHHHPAHHADAAASTAEPGHKWPGDAPLREQMSALHVRYQAHLVQIRDGRLKTADYRTLATATRTALARIVAECRLTAQADAALHHIIADLLASADIMDGTAKGKRVTAARSAVGALNHYGERFEHPGWRPLSLAHAT